MFLNFIAFSLFVALCWAGVPWIGEPRTDAYFTQHHQGLLAQTKAHKSDLKVIFFGDSITEVWSVNGRDIWNKNYATRHAFNYGIAGDRTENLVWRMENGEFDGLDSKLVVLNIGTNNVGANTDADIAKGIREVVDQILHRQQHARVLLLGIIPRDGKWFATNIQSINSMIAKYNDDKRVFYLDMSSHFQTAPGVEVSDLYGPDKIHPTTKGYQTWHDVMEPLFSKLYNM